MQVIIGFFQVIDKFLFKQVDQVKDSALYQQMIDQLFNPLNENQQKILNQILSVVAIAIPLFIVMVMFISNFSSRRELNVKREILSLMKSRHDLKIKLKNVGRDAIVSYLLKNQKELELKIIKVLRQNGISKEDVKVENFNTSNISDITKVQASIHFSNLSTLQFTKFTQDLVKIEKFKISRLDISKGGKKGLLKGELDVIQFGKVVKKKL